MIQALERRRPGHPALNRRGFHTFVLCPRCGHVVKCHACDVAATYHKSRHILICHTCDAERPCPPACPACRRARPALRRHRHRAARARDPGGVSRSRRRGGWTPTRCARPAATSRCSSAFKAGEVRILLGTQMIAKGLDFPERDAGGRGQRRHGAASAGLPRGRAAPSSSWRRWPGGRAAAIGPGGCSCRPTRPDHPAIRSAVTARLRRRSRRASCPSGRNTACPPSAGWSG